MKLVQMIWFNLLAMKLVQMIWFNLLATA